MTLAHVGVVACACVSALGQPACLIDSNADGHPRFAASAVRVAPETMGLLKVSMHSGSADFGDLDGDGDIDAVACFGTKSNYIAVRLNLGDGVMQGGPVYPVGDGAIAVALGDVDGDGDLDVATANSIANTVTLWLAAGDGSLHSRVDIPAGTSPSFVALERLNTDEALDLIVLNTDSKDLWIRMGVGNGTFAPETRVAVPGVITAKGFDWAEPAPTIGIGDLDGDGDLDLVTPSSNPPSAFVNDDGLFTLWPTPVIGVGLPHTIVIADLDGNGWNDIACTSISDGIKSLRILLSDGPFLFRPGAAYDAGHLLETGGSVHTLDLGDWDGDGDLDALAAHKLNDKLMLLRNAGDGTFLPKQPITIAEQAWFARFVDLNADGRPDIAAISSQSRGMLHTLFNLGGEMFPLQRYPAKHLVTPPGLYAFTTGDTDNDGDIDLVATSGSTGKIDLAVRVFENPGDGTFEHWHDTHVDPELLIRGVHVDAGDLDADGRLDLVIADEGEWEKSGAILVMRNLGNHQFEPVQHIVLDGVFPRTVRLADLDHDGDLDAVVWTIQSYPGNDEQPVPRWLQVLINPGDGQLEPQPPVKIDDANFTGYGFGIDFVDVDLDGHLDIIAIVDRGQSTPGNLHVLLGNGEGAFTLHQTLTNLKRPRDVVRLPGTDDVVAVMNGRDSFIDPFTDPYLSLVRLRPEPHTIRKFYDPRLTAWASLDAVEIEGRISIALTSDSAATNILLSPDLGIASIANYPAGTWTAGAAQVDVDGDGRRDLVIRRGDSSFAVQLARPCPACIPDCDEDGDLDVMDYLCFLDRFADRDPRADMEHDGDWDLFDLLAYQGLFAAGCD